MKTIAFFNNKGGVGKTSLVYHLAWMYAELGVNVVAADLDPQANLTTMFLDEDTLEDLWAGSTGRTVMSPIRPLLEGEGGIDEPVYEEINGIALLAGDLSLSSFEDELSLQWSRCLEGDKRAFRVIAAFHEVIARCARAREADLVLLDVGPSLGAINRAALVAADHVVVPLAPDLFSLKGLENLGPRLRAWRDGWRERLDKRPESMDLPEGRMAPAGYIVMQHAVRLDRPVKAYSRWMERIPRTYREAVLDEHARVLAPIANDPYCLATLKHFRSLMPLAQEARKPMFALRPADGAIGGHAQAVQDCHRDFRTLAREIAKRTGIALS
ncbi:MinD/ParA/CobQ/CobA-like protein [Planctomycetes bacterium Pla163]|uniref:MinD/ParA/CobQ/CobA-like protein n=1 Tax=Rohdeia mirabilis TaxID=2528008 RepID=A0A518CV77_9BACT|nr:MinD/ParA/CobQ/CobA-like protein [Planctomycetes bacterium Pla163]